MRQRVVTCAGFVLLGMGGIGLFLPIWPTTPFVLAAAGCFSGNPAMRARLYRSRYFAEYLENRRTGCGISKATRNGSITVLWSMLLLSAFVVHKPYLWVILGIVGVAVTLHLLYLTKPKNRS